MAAGIKIYKIEKDSKEKKSQMRNPIRLAPFVRCLGWENAQKPLGVFVPKSLL